MEASEADPSPLALVATTVKVYAELLVRPVTSHDVVAVVQVSPEPSDTVELVTAEPLAPAAVQETEAEVSPAVADTLVAAPG